MEKTEAENIARYYRQIAGSLIEVGQEILSEASKIEPGQDESADLEIMDRVCNILTGLKRRPGNHG